MHFRVTNNLGEYVSQNFTSMPRAKDFAMERRVKELENQAKQPNYTAKHFTVVSVSDVWTTSTLEDAIKEEWDQKYHSFKPVEERSEERSDAEAHNKRMIAESLARSMGKDELADKLAGQPKVETKPEAEAGVEPQAE